MSMMLKVKSAYQSYYVANTLDIQLEETSHVIIQTPNGLELAKIVEFLTITSAIESEETPFQLIRKATTQDLEQNEKNNAKKQEFQRLFQKLTKELQLEMRLVDIHIAFNKDKVTFFYMSDTRIDFRQLVKNLANVIKSRIELRQINDRDRAKLVSGLGPCGYELCCSKFLQEFATVNVKMAKVQQLSFNLQRVTGLCDRLLCCLKYEHEHYIEMKKEVPDLNRRIMLDDGRKAKVVGLQLISRQITLKYEDQSMEILNFEDFLKVYTANTKKEESLDERRSDQ